MRATYHTNNRRRGWVAAILLAIGVPFTALAVAFWITVDDAAGKRPSTGGDALALPSLVVGLGVGMVLLGAWSGLWFLGHRDEVFEVHENGLRHARAGGSQSIRWSDIERVVVRDGKNTAFAQWAGWNIHRTIHLAGGGKLTITGLTENAAQLLEHVDTRGT